jgi:PAS domain-containing protein
MFVHGDCWLHPDSVPLFDNSVVADTVSWCGSAVVTQRYEAPQGGSADGYNLTSGVLNPHEETPLLLALLGPESSADFRICNTCFGELVGGIQTDFGALMTLARESTERLDTVEPALVALRSDSVVVAVNEALAKQLGRQRAELEGRTTDEITAMLADRSMQIAEAIRLDDAVLPVSTVGFRRTPVVAGGLGNQSARRLSGRLATSVQQIADSVSRLSQSAAESDGASLRDDLAEVAVHAQQTADVAAALRRRFGTNQSGAVR